MFIREDGEKVGHFYWRSVKQTASDHSAPGTETHWCESILMSYCSIWLIGPSRRNSPFAHLLLLLRTPFARSPTRTAGWVRERKAEHEKRELNKKDESQGFPHLGHSNWTNCSLLSWFCSEIFPLFYHSYWGVQLIITLERERKAEYEKRELAKMDETQGFPYLGHSNWTIFVLLSKLYFPNFTIFSLSYWRPILITPEG